MCTNMQNNSVSEILGYLLLCVQSKHQSASKVRVVLFYGHFPEQNIRTVHGHNTLYRRVCNNSTYLQTVYYR